MSEEPALFVKEGLTARIPFVHMATNMRIEESRWRTRHAWVELKLKSGPAEWVTLATQGAVWYNPRLGSGPRSLSQGIPGIVESAEGKLFRITVGNQDFSVEDISSGVVGRPSMRLVWMSVGENYVIRTDGASLTQIYDGTQTVTSNGYNINQPTLSGLPNFAGPNAYTDRFWIVNRGRDIIAGDHLHRIDQFSAVDLLKTTDQTYDLTSKSFPPPANLGDVSSMWVVTSARGGGLPSQAEVMSGTDLHAVWGVLGGTPRANWPTTPMTRIVHPQTGPTGPYAASAGRNELLMRSWEGITSLKYFERDTDKPGNPMVNLGQEIKPLLDNDPPDLLPFATVINSIGRQRAGFSVAPRVSGRQRWHRGYVTATFQPNRTRIPDQMVWEGIHTLPERMGEIVQFIEGVQFGTKRIFAIIRKPDGTKGLAEWTTEDGPDRLADGTCVPQTWQILTRRLTRSEYQQHTWGAAFMRIQDVREGVEVKIFARVRENEDFKEVSCKNLTNDDWGKKGTLADSRSISLSTLTKNMTGGEWLQLLIVGTGSCCIDVAIADSTSAMPDDQARREPCLVGASCKPDLFIRSK